MVLDEPGEDDIVFVLEDITYAINKSLFERARPIKVDFIQRFGEEGLFIFSRLGQDSGSSCC